MSFVFSSLQVNNIRHATGISLCAPVRVATTSNGALATAYENADVIDGVTLATNDRILLKDQTTSSENGIYIVQASSAPVRADDMATGEAANGIIVWVLEGTSGKNSGWTCTSAAGSDIVGTNNMTFTQYDVVNALSVARGGSGATTFTSGNFLQGNGASAVTATKAVPTGIVVGTSDAQTLTNKTINTASNTITIATADVTSGTFADARIAVSNVTQHEGSIAIGNLSGAPTGTVVGTTDAQTLTNKTINTASNTITIATGDVTSGTFADARIATSNVTQHEGDITIGNLTGAPTGAVIGTTDAQTLTNKTFGDNLNMSNNKIINLATPTGDTDAATKAYADSIASGLDTKDSVRVSTTVDLSGLGTGYSYNSTGGASSRGQITWTTGPTTIDGVTLANNDRVLVKDNSVGAENGIWIRTSQNTWDRATDFDTDAEVTAGAYVFIAEGTTNADSGWILTTNDPVTIGGASGTALSFTQFSGAGQITGGDGLDKSGSTMSVDLKANGGLVIESTEMAVDLGASSITGTLAVGDGGTGLTTFGGANTILYTTAADALTSITAGANGVLVTNGSNVPSISSTLPSGMAMTSAVLTTPQINDTSSDHQYIFAASELTSDRTVTLPLLTGNDTFVFEAHAQTLTNKTINSDNNTITNIVNADIKAAAAIDVTKIADGSVTSTEFQHLSGVTSAIQSQIDNHLADTTTHGVSGNIVGTSDAQTLTNKTLTSPKIGTAITDTNGNELLALTATGSAINEFTIANAATLSGPTISVTGGDSSVDFNLQTKGAGTYRFLSTNATAAELRLYEDTDDGSNYVGLKAGTLGSNLTLTLPVSDGSNGDMLVTNGSGVLSFLTPTVPTTRVAYIIAVQQINVDIISFGTGTIGYFSWNNSRHSGYTNGTLVYEVDDLNDRDFQIRIYNITGSSAVVTSSVITTNGFKTLAFTNPGADARLAIQVKKSATGGTNPKVYGISLEWTP